jgi:adenosine deaminase
MNWKTRPKVELHCHLGGILDPGMARDIRQQDPAFPIDPDQFERAYPVCDFEDLGRWVDFTAPIAGELDNYRPILSRYIKHLKAQRVLYSEIMIPGAGLFRDEAEAVEKVQAFRDWVTCQEDGEIQVELLASSGRGKSPEQMRAGEERILALHKAGLIVGIALAGLERGHPVKPFHSTFARFHRAGLRIEIHAGELCGPESIWDALEYGYPDRIGHGVSLFQDPRLVDVFQQQQIHIEMCPTSNLKTGSVSRIEDHPIARARELGLNYSVNTDDPGAFGCSMESEYELLVRALGFDESDFQRIYANSLASRFQPCLRVGDTRQGAGLAAPL